MMFQTNMSSSGIDKAAYKDLLSELKDSAKSISDEVDEAAFSLYITPQNKAVGQSCTFSFKDKDLGADEVSLNYVIDDKATGGSKALSVSVDGDDYFYATQQASSAQDGEVVLAVQDPSANKSVGLKVDYSGVKKAQFMGASTYVGEYKISLHDPDNMVKNFLLSNIYDPTAQGFLKDLTQSTVTVKTSLSGNKMDTAVDMNLSGLGELKVSQTTTEKSSGKITIPDVDSSKTIAIASQGGTGDNGYALMDDYQKSALQYLSNVMKDHSELSELLSAVGLTPEMINYELQYD